MQFRVGRASRLPNADASRGGVSTTRHGRMKRWFHTLQTEGRVRCAVTGQARRLPYFLLHRSGLTGTIQLN